MRRANAAKQQAAYVTPQLKPALPVLLPQSGRQVRKGLLLWYHITDRTMARAACFVSGPLLSAQGITGEDLSMLESLPV
ncbi:hypothetical protein D3Z39_03330 [Anaerotruncus colihominis]|uniref:Uncharacterized protein n=1 Tax=Anaerotruncus colihominis TaxID=169435 RepID=A0A845RCM0_9FIRM|nr:hypothetical protein [Anaerotruncus colihominis]